MDVFASVRLHCHGEYYEIQTVWVGSCGWVGSLWGGAGTGLLFMRPHLFHIWIKKSARENFVVSQSSWQLVWTEKGLYGRSGICFILYPTAPSKEHIR